MWMSCWRRRRRNWEWAPPIPVLPPPGMEEARGPGHPGAGWRVGDVSTGRRHGCLEVPQPHGRPRSLTSCSRRLDPANVCWSPWFFWFLLSFFSRWGWWPFPTHHRALSLKSSAITYTYTNTDAHILSMYTHTYTYTYTQMHTCIICILYTHIFINISIIHVCILCMNI